MGIGSAIKDAFKTDSRVDSAANGSSFDADAAGTANGGSKFKDSSAQGSTGGSYNLPSGTGPGTTGVPDSDGKGSSASAPKGEQEDKYSNDVKSGTTSNATVNNHRDGHLGASSKDVMPSGNTNQDHLHLNPVIKEHVRHIETEEVQRMKERDRHVHHVQHHLQPIKASEELEEKHHENIHPVTQIHEQHVNKPEENALLERQVFQHRDTVHHGAKERHVIDKGTIVNENVHHHVHHVIQPVIEKETFDKHRIHTTIPIHEVTHEAPIVHQSQSHAPISVDQFLENGGLLSGGLQPGDAADKLLQQGKCTRQVDGVANRMEKELNLSTTSGATGDFSNTPAGQDVDNRLL